METIKFREKNPKKTHRKKVRYRGPKKKSKFSNSEFKKKLFKKKNMARTHTFSKKCGIFTGLGLVPKAHVFGKNSPKTFEKKKCGKNAGFLRAWV
jgi:hypothetical protein